MQRGDERLELAHAAVVGGVCGKHSLGRKKVAGDVAPVVVAARLVVFKILHRHDLHMCDTEFGQMVERRFDLRVVTEARARLRESEVEAAIFHAGVRRNGEIADMHFVDHHVRRRIDRRPGGRRRGQVADLAARAVRRRANGVRIEHLALRIQLRSFEPVAVKFSAQVAFDFQFPDAVLLLPETLFDASFRSNGCIVNHEVHIFRIRCEQPENRSLAREERAETDAQFLAGSAVHHLGFLNRFWSEGGRLRGRLFLFSLNLFHNSVRSSNNVRGVERNATVASHVNHRDILRRDFAHLNQTSRRYLRRSHDFSTDDRRKNRRLLQRHFLRPSLLVFNQPREQIRPWRRRRARLRSRCRRGFRRRRGRRSRLRLASDEAFRKCSETLPRLCGRLLPAVHRVAKSRTTNHDEHQQKFPAPRAATLFSGTTLRVCRRTRLTRRRRRTSHWSLWRFDRHARLRHWNVERLSANWALDLVTGPRAVEFQALLAMGARSFHRGLRRDGLRAGALPLPATKHKPRLAEKRRFCTLSGDV